MNGHSREKTARALIEACRERGIRVAVAESCTGGLLGAAITAVSGSSDVFEGGVLAYQNRVKTKLLGVSEEVFATVGAVSEACACQMAAGAAALLGTTLAISITGIAGPGGATETKPVGLVYIGIFYKGSVTARAWQFAGDREAVRAEAVETALQEALEALRKARD